MEMVHLFFRGRVGLFFWSSGCFKRIETNTSVLCLLFLHGEKTRYCVCARVEEVWHHTSICTLRAVMLASVAGRSNCTNERLLLPPVLSTTGCGPSVQGSVPQSASLQARGEQKDVPVSASVLQQQRHSEAGPFSKARKSQKLPFIDKDSILAVSTLAEYCKGRNAQAGWTCLS